MLLNIFFVTGQLISEDYGVEHDNVAVSGGGHYTVHSTLFPR